MKTITFPAVTLEAFEVTPQVALDEIKRRQDNRQVLPGQAKKEPAHPHLRNLSGKVLAEIAGIAQVKPARKAKAQPTQAPKAQVSAGASRKGGRPPAGGEGHGALRRDAVPALQSAFWKATGENLSRHDACVIAGTLPAAEMQGATVPGKRKIATQKALAADIAGNPVYFLQEFFQDFLVDA